jgi:fructokinase
MKNIRFNEIICFGEVLWDVLPAGKKPGGAPLNVAIHLKKQGINSAIVSSIGADSEGAELKQFLIAAGVDVRFLETDSSLPTSEVLVHLDAQKNATYEICEPVAWDNIQLNSKLESKAVKAGIVIYGSLASRNRTTRETLLHLLKSSDATRLLDVNLRPPYDSPEVVKDLLGLADFIKLNDEELFRIAAWNNKAGDEKDLIQWMAEFYNCPIICVTRGTNGAALFIGGEIYEHPGFKVNAVDTVGAGDSFLAGLVAGLSENRSPEKSLEYACAVGAFVASQHGAVPHYTKKDTAVLLNKQDKK